MTHPIRLLLILVFGGLYLSCQSQTNKSPVASLKVSPPVMGKAAQQFLESLSPKQREIALFKFDDGERFNWHYIPKSRKGIPLGDMSPSQEKAAMELLRAALSDTGFMKAKSIIELEAILREAEGRPANDDYRDRRKYYFSMFGNPATDSIWGWRLEGHHISLNFSSQNNKIVSGTPGFFGTNPAIVLSGPEKGKYILKDETDLGLTLLRSLGPSQIDKAIFSNNAPGDIITGSSRKAMINDQKGILYSELNPSQQRIFLQLMSVYVNRYARVFALDMMQEIESAGMGQLRFAWAGDRESGVGHPHYYRIQGPTIIIEYDNTQNNANHIHTVVRDLNHDFGGDELLEHYKKHSH